MNMAPSAGSDGPSALCASIDSTTTLVKNFQIALQNRTQPTLDVPDPPNPLRLLSDAASILKAQTTKLSLLILNKPFTPSAITFVLNSLSNQCLPALISALELCTAAQWTSFLQQHLRASLSHIMGQYLDLITSIPTDEHGIDTDAGRGVLATTGVLWESCDKLVELASSGLVSLAVQKADSYHALIKDAIIELEDWNPNELEDDSEDDSDDDSLQEQLGRTHIKADGLASAISDQHTNDTAPLPSTTTTHLQSLSLSHLRLLRLLYPALRKRRLATFPPIIGATPISFTFPTAPQLQRMDILIHHLKQFSEEADEIAGALYEGKEEDLKRRLTGLREMGMACVAGAKLDWSDKNDEFSEWADKWLGRLRELEST